MDKINYLVKTLSRTNRKDYENYVINRIWNILDDPEIKPVSQQYVRRPNGKYALIDLYFPQINIGIECDELQHIQEADKKGKTSDEMRTEDLLSAIENYREIRIPIYKIDRDSKEVTLLTLNEINKSIDEAVAAIRVAKKERKDFTPWSDKTDLELAKERGVIHSSDNFHFRVSGEVRSFFGKSDANSQKCFYKVNDSEDHLWLPHLAIELDAGKITAGSASGYINLYSPKDGLIYEHLVRNKKIKSDVELSELMHESENFNRITFAKSRDNLGRSSYKFLGVFRKIGKTKTLTINGKEMEFTIHKLVSEKVDLNGKF